MPALLGRAVEKAQQQLGYWWDIDPQHSGTMLANPKLRLWRAAM